VTRLGDEVCRVVGCSSLIIFCIVDDRGGERKNNLDVVEWRPKRVFFIKAWTPPLSVGSELEKNGKLCTRSIMWWHRGRFSADKAALRALFDNGEE